jgi:ATP-dependent exoDNAse (exonuclease V) alpha subunit
MLGIKGMTCNATGTGNGGNSATQGRHRIPFNCDVDTLNAELRQVRRERGELAGPDVRFTTKHGEADFSPGDRVQFTDTDKRAGIYNGNVGTIPSK